MAEGIDAEFAGAIYDDEAGGTAQSVAPHRNGCSNAGRMGVYAYGEGDAVFVQKRFQRHGGHCFMVFEDGVDSQQFDVIAEVLLDPLSLRNPVRDTAGTEHLECLDHNDFASKIGESWVGVRVKPAGDS